MLRNLGRALVNLIVLVCILYGVGMLLYWIGRGIIGERFFLINLANSLMPVIALPVLIALPITLLARRWRASLLLAPTVIALIVLYGGRFIPRETVFASEPTLRVMTFNIASRSSDFERTIALIRQSDAHLVAIQEFNNAADAALTPALSDLYPYSLRHPVAPYALGMAIYSKFPLRDGAFFDSIRLGSQRVTVEQANGGALLMYNVHPIPPQRDGLLFDTRVRSAEIGVLLDDMAGQPDDLPVIMAGDFNMTDQSDDHARVRAAGLDDAYALVGDGFGPTFPWLGRFFGEQVAWVPPLIRIDYVFFSRGWASAESAQVGADSGGSDHYPVTVTLRVGG